MVEYREAFVLLTHGVLGTSSIRFASLRCATNPQGTEGGGVPAPSVTWRLSTALKDPAYTRSSFDGPPTDRRKTSTIRHRPISAGSTLLGVAATFFKGTTRDTYALHPEVPGRPTRPSRSGLSPALPPGHTPIWAILYSPVLGREIRCIFRFALRSLYRQT
jgi:hypothetical protein